MCPIKVIIVNSTQETGPSVSSTATLEQTLRADEGDAGCERVLPMLHVYVNLVAAGERATELHPSIPTHPPSYDACREDYKGLLASVRGIRR
jgi:hypothetical protein